MDEIAQIEPVKVFCRIRPSVADDEECISCINEKTLSIYDPRHKSKSVYTFSRVFSPCSTQSDIFYSCLLPYVESFLKGENALFFNYGVTGSGKTYTMQGSLEDPGLIPRTLDTIFNSIASYSTLKYVVKPNGHNGFDIQTEAEAIMLRQRLDYSTKWTPIKGDVTLASLENRLVESSVIPISQQYLYAVFVSFFELYNDGIYDLLDSSNCGRPLSLYEDASRNTYVNGAVELEVKSPNEALQAYYRGQQRRHVGSTVLNNESSRSHGIFSIRIVRTGYDQTYDEAIMDKNLLSVSQLCLVDLAGSERTHRSGTAGARLKEASTINKSLMALRQCIDVLRTNQASKLLRNQTVQQHIVPYRDCKLTRVFKSFFDGRGQVAILVCVHPTLREISETTQVLLFADSSQKVSTVVPTTPVNIDTNFSARSSENLSDLIAFNNNILEALATVESLDTKLLEATSVITSNDLDEYVFTCDGCDSDKKHHSSRRSRGSFSGDVHHTSTCSFLSILQERIDERQKVRELLSQFAVEAKSSLDDVMSRAESDSNRTLIDAIEKLKVEKLQMDSKIRCLVNEVTRLKTLRSNERNEHDREISGSKAQIKRLKDQLTSLQVVRSIPRTRRDRHDSISSTSTTDEASSLRYNLRKAVGIPSTTNRVAVLSRQWESRMAKQMQDTATKRFRREENEDRLSMSRSRTEMALAEASNRPPAMNPRHRRSKSVGGDHSVWLEHKEDRPAPLGTILSPTGINVRKSSTKINLEDTLKATNYVLHHQTTTQEGDVETKLYKGSIIPTAGGGSAVVFKDVEELRQVSPLSTSLRRSSRLSLKLKRPLTTDDNASDADKENDTLEIDKNGKDENILAPTKRRVTPSTMRASLISSTSFVSTATGQTDEDGDDKSYNTINPPSPAQYLGYSYNGGVSGGFKH